MKIVIRKTVFNEWKKSIAISMILFSNLVIGSAKYLNYVYVLMTFILLYVIFITAKSPRKTNEVFCSIPILWIFICSIWMFFYGYYGQYPEEYSLKFHLLNIVSVVLILVILYHCAESIPSVLAKANGITILLMSMFIFMTEKGDIISLLSGSIGRVGYTAVGNVNTTAVSYIVLLIPIMYKLLVEKNKHYVLTAIIGSFFLLITGSKKAFIALMLMIFICNLGKSNNKWRTVINLLKAIGILIIVILACYFIPVLNEMIWTRLVSMIDILNNYSAGDQSSTGLRYGFIITALTKAWDKPFFGHGWGSFAHMYGYSTLYKINLYTHCNYTEILFSFGLIGFLVFYSLPIYVISRMRKIKNSNIAILVTLYIVCLLFVDFSTVTSYASILGYLGFSTIYLLERRNV